MAEEYSLVAMSSHNKTENDLSRTSNILSLRYSSSPFMSHNSSSDNEDSHTCMGLKLRAVLMQLVNVPTMILELRGWVTLNGKLCM